jgi:hypothetical protein
MMEGFELLCLRLKPRTIEDKTVRFHQGSCLNASHVARRMIKIMRLTRTMGTMYWLYHMTSSQMHCHETPDVEGGGTDGLEFDEVPTMGGGNRAASSSAI